MYVISLLFLQIYRFTFFLSFFLLSHTNAWIHRTFFYSSAFTELLRLTIADVFSLSGFVWWMCDTVLWMVVCTMMIIIILLWFYSLQIYRIKIGFFYSWNFEFWIFLDRTCRFKVIFFRTHPEAYSGRVFWVNSLFGKFFNLLGVFKEKIPVHIKKNSLDGMSNKPTKLYRYESTESLNCLQIGKPWHHVYKLECSPMKTIIQAIQNRINSSQNPLLIYTFPLQWQWQITISSYWN